MNSRTSHPRVRSDSGAALILTIVWSAVLLLLAGVVSTAVLNQVRPSDRAEKSFEAWSAAEAGVDDMRARLAANGTYWKTVVAYFADPVANAAAATANPALGGWASVPGGTSGAQYTYSLDATNAARTGRLVITSTGKAGTGQTEVIRTVEAEVRKKTTTDYAYLSNSETYPYDAPGVYSPVGSNPNGQEKMTKDVAEVLCGTGGAGGTHYWYQWTDWTVNGSTLPYGPVATTSKKVATITNYGPHKNSVACLHGQVNAAGSKQDYFVGPVHTNDVWYLDPSILNVDPLTTPPLTNQVFRGAVTSSCPGVTPGSTTNGTCRDDHRWISTATLPNESNMGVDPRYSAFIANEIPNNASENNKLWNPTYDEVVEMPSVAMLTTLKGLATSKGCVFSGPTRIRLTTVAGAGKVIVTSPDTVDSSTNAFCFGGQSYYANDPKVHSTVTLDYATMVAAGFNGIFYVQDSSLGAVAPSCKPKTSPALVNQGTYPWVIPTAASETIGVVTGSPKGFPSADTRFLGDGQTPNGLYDPWTDVPSAQCSKGHLYIQSNATNGGYTGQYTIAADADIVITDDLVESSVVSGGRASASIGDLWGIPQTTSTNQLGLVPRGWIYVYSLDGQYGGSSSVNAQISDLLLDFALLAPNKCLTVQSYNFSGSLGKLKIVGSVGQDFRCRFTDPSSGYTSILFVYDERLPLLGPPPYMAELSQEPWKPTSWSETNVRRDTMARAGVPAVSGTQSKGTTKDFNVLAGATAGTTLLYARVVGGTGTAQVANGQVRYIAPSGVTSTVVEFVVRKPDGTRVGQTLTISVT